MFIRAGNSLHISRGDTGVLRISIVSAYQATSDDRILFTVKDKDGTPVIVQILTPEDNVVLVEFTNEMTKDLTPKNYKYDIRLVLNAEIEGGEIVGGEVVSTPFKPALFKVLEVVGDV